MRKKSNFELKLNEYYEAFKENYPLMITGGWTEEDVMKDIDRCISEGKPAEKRKLEKDKIY